MNGWEWLTLILPLWYAGYLVRMSWWFGRLRPAKEKTEWPSVSVIVPVRNEEHNIGACLESLARQDYPHFEVVVVDDHSEDGTRKVVEEKARGNARIKWMALEKKSGVAYKKAAVAAGIGATKGEIIVTTDGDCEMGEHWLRGMVSEMGTDVGMVTGPVQLTGKSIFQRFQALEFMGLIAVGAGSISSGRPTMCNGANLAYRRSVFEAVGGFAGIDHIASGDDELLMHKIARETDHEVRFAKSRTAIVRTAALPTWQAFRAQRIRWVSKSTQYEERRITYTLVASYLAMVSIVLLSLGAVLFPEFRPVALAALGLKIIGEASILIPAGTFFGNLHLLIWLLPEQLAHIAYVLWIGLAGNQKSYTWKGRHVR